MVAHESGLSHPMTALGRWARRIVSEDSIHSITSLPTAVHPFPESKNLVVVLIAQTASREQRYRAPPQPEILCLLSQDRKPIKERYDLDRLIRKSIDLPIPTAVASPPQTAAPESLPKEIQRHTVVLRNIEGS